MENSWYVWEEEAAAQALFQQPSVAKLILGTAMKLDFCWLTLHCIAIVYIGVNWPYQQPISQLRDQEAL